MMLKKYLIIIVKKNKKCLEIIYEYNLKFNKYTYYNVQLSIF